VGATRQNSNATEGDDRAVVTVVTVELWLIHYLQSTVIALGRFPKFIETQNCLKTQLRLWNEFWVKFQK
jgi:hypothetical protein